MGASAGAAGMGAAGGGGFFAQAASGGGGGGLLGGLLSNPQVGLGAQGVATGLSTLGVFGQGAAAQAAEDYKAKTAAGNSRLADAMAHEEGRRGAFNAADALAKGKRLQSLAANDIRAQVGQQKVMLAANGIEVGGEGSGAALVQTTLRLGEEDQNQIINNSEREAHAIRLGSMDAQTALQQQAFNFSSSADMHAAAADNLGTAKFIGAGETLLTGITKGAFALDELEQQGVV